MLSDCGAERTALVIGGASGIGWAVAKGLTGEVLDLNGGAHLKRYPDILAHIDRMA